MNFKLEDFTINYIELSTLEKIAEEKFIELEQEIIDIDKDAVIEDIKKFYDDNIKEDKDKSILDYLYKDLNVSY